jgi:mRNA interferase RelE/StbE
MASFNIAFKPSVQKDFHRLSKSAAGRVVKRIEKLKDEPFPHGVDKLEGAERLYRLRVGDYRIVYQVDTRVQQIVILYVRHRRDVYRAL